MFLQMPPGLNKCEIRQGNALSVLRQMATDSVDCCVTSPPYYGLRAYGTSPQIWDGDDGCGHDWAEYKRMGITGGTASDKVHIKGRDNLEVVPPVTQSTCSECGAWRGELGAEPTVELYVSHMTSIMREVRRVVKGTLWLNIGDSYNGSGGAGGDYQPGGLKDGQPKYPGRHLSHLPPKSLIGVPWRLAFALQDDGWVLRSDIIWEKPAPMPESVMDRPTKAHEYLFLLAKNGSYYYDADAIAEPSANAGKVVKLGDKSFSRGLSTGKGIEPSGNGCADEYVVKETRNKRSVWRIPAKPYKGAHFAVMPEALVEPCILAGCPEGGTVLDPFAGSGTVGVVALRHNRNFVGIELNPQYIELAETRITGDNPLFNRVLVKNG